MSTHDDEATTPAERYAAFQRGKPYPMLKDFEGLHGFELDDFQLRACREIEDGRGVLVAAPTGSGKTIVGEFAIHLALQTGRKAFYTTPIKALSNQKYHDLVKRYGADKVGLLTGDNVVNGEAPVVVMTTTSSRPSSSWAPSVIRRPPPNDGPLPTATSIASCSRVSPSSCRT